MTKKKQRLTKEELRAMKAYQYCMKVFDEMEVNKATDRHRQEATEITDTTISDDLDYKTCNILLKLNCLTPEENTAIQEALQAYEEGIVDEEEYELIDKMITDSDLNNLEQIFKNKKK